MEILKIVWLSLGSIVTLVLEPNGKISFLPKSINRPATLDQDDNLSIYMKVNNNNVDDMF